MVGAPKGPTDTCHIDFGSTLHEFIEEFYTYPDKDLTKDELRDRLSKVVTPKTKSKMEPTVDNFFAWEERHGYRGMEPFQHKKGNFDTAQLFLEEDFLMTIAPDLPPVKGAVDFYCKDTGHLVDWKTGKGDDFFKYNKEFPFGYVLQAVTYCVHERMRNRHVNNCEFFFTVPGKSGFINPNIDDQWLEATVRDMMKYIDNGIFYRNRTKLCGWCEYSMHCE